MNRFYQWPGHGWLALAARWYLGWVFLFACFHKILHPASFALDIATYDILPLSLVNLMAIMLPWAELAAGLLLVLGWRARAAALVVAGMMVMFVVSLLLALNAGLDMSCGCFASQAAQDQDPINGMTVLRDLGWLALALYVVIFDRVPLGIDRLRKQRSEKDV